MLKQYQNASTVKLRNHPFGTAQQRLSHAFGAEINGSLDSTLQ